MPATVTNVKAVAAKNNFLIVSPFLVSACGSGSCPDSGAKSVF